MLARVASLIGSSSEEEKGHALRAQRRRQELQARKIVKRYKNSPKQCPLLDPMKSDTCFPKEHKSCFFHFDLSKEDSFATSGCSKETDEGGKEWGDGRCIAREDSTVVECFCDDQDLCGSNRIEMLRRAQKAYNDKNPTTTTPSFGTPPEKSVDDAL